MKRILRPAGALLLCSALFTPAVHAYLTVAGNGTAPATAGGTTFVTTPTAAVFYKPTGEYYFGLAANANANAYTISYGNYRTPDVAPTLTPIGSATAITDLNIAKLAVVPYSGDLTSPTILSVVGNPQTTAILTAITKTNFATPVQTAALLDSAGGANTGIRGLCASNGTDANSLNVAFAATKLAGGTGIAFGAGAVAGVAGATTDGIMGILMGRDATTGAPVFTNLGGNGANSRVFDLTVSGSYAIIDTVTAGAVTVGASGTQYGDYPAMWYDGILGRLYVGTTARIAASGGAGADGLFSVGIYPVTITATTIQIGAAQNPIWSTTANAGWANIGTGTATAPAVNNIVAIREVNVAKGASAQMLRTMHTSTGFVYLIVNGGVLSGSASAAAIAASASNQMFAVPLVGLNAVDVTGLAAANTIGSFADVTTADFRRIAGSSNATLMNTGSIACLIGGNGQLPFTAVANGVSDMYVDGDAVYVALGNSAGVPDTAINPGVYKSQALFDEQGKIDHWTDWQRIAPADMGSNALPSTGADGRVDFVAVDGYTGHIWTTNLTSQVTNVTQWTAPTVLTQQSGLPAAVNAALPGGLCYSVLDLNSSVTGWGGTTPSRVTLFGGQEKVCFAITGSGSATPAASNGNYQRLNVPLITTGATNNVYDYTSTQTFFTTTLPSGAGAVTSLAFSGWNQDTTTGTTVGFFLAGCAGTSATGGGLYAWAVTTSGAGFSTIGVLNDFRVAPWMTTLNSWQQITNVAGTPVKIMSAGGGLHVLTRTATLDRIYSTQKGATVAALNTSFVVTASSGNTPVAGQTYSDLSAVKKIYDFVISVTATANVGGGGLATGNEQLMILTNDGIYTTSSFTGMQSPSTAAVQSQLQAGWVRIAAPVTSGFLTDYIGQPAYQRQPQTFWFGNWAPNSTSGIYNQYIWYQMSRQSFTGNGSPTNNSITNAISYTEDPSNTATFNAATSFNQTTAPTLYATFPVNARLFFNDGARRFFVQKNPANDGAYQILVLPYDLTSYNITANGKAPMSDAAVAAAGAFYWMGTAGDSGRLLMGTSAGVIALQ